jgi:hypothetical protein
MENNDFIKKSLMTDIGRTFDEYLSSYSGELDYEFIGKVVDNKDPEKLGRCKIKSLESNSEIQDKDLPWALPEQDFVGSLKGSLIIPPIGAVVWFYYQNGDIYFPIYRKKVINKSKMPTNKNVDYPDNMIFFETDNGDKFEINRRRKSVLFEHSSGTKIEIDAIGNVTIDSKGSINLKHGLFLTDNGGAVIPEGQGPFCALPSCVITGTPHTGTKCSPGF